MEDKKVLILDKSMQAWQGELNTLIERMHRDLIQGLHIELSINDVFLLSLTELGDLCNQKDFQESFNAPPENVVLNRLKHAMQKQTALTLRLDECLILSVIEVGQYLGIDKALAKADEI